MRTLLIAVAALMLAGCSENSVWWKANNAWGTGTFPVANELAGLGEFVFRRKDFGGRLRDAFLEEQSGGSEGRAGEETALHGLVEHSIG